MKFPEIDKSEIWKPVIGLILNLMLPGVGTFVCAFLGKGGGNHSPTLTAGIIQCCLYFGGWVGYFAGMLLSWTLIGLVLCIAIILCPIAWIWALVWSIMFLVSVNNGPTPQQATPVYVNQPPSGYYTAPMAAPGAAPGATPGAYYADAGAAPVAAPTSGAETTSQPTFYAQPSDPESGASPQVLHVDQPEGYQPQYPPQEQQQYPPQQQYPSQDQQQYPPQQQYPSQDQQQYPPQ